MEIELPYIKSGLDHLMAGLWILSVTQPLSHLWQKAPCFQHDQLVSFRRSIGNSAPNSAQFSNGHPQLLRLSDHFAHRYQKHHETDFKQPSPSRWRRATPA
jgi:hypothetical protein